MEMMWLKGKTWSSKVWNGVVKTQREHPRDRNWNLKAQNKVCRGHKWGEGEGRADGQEQGARPRRGILGKEVGIQGTRWGSKAQGWWWGSGGEGRVPGSEE